MDICWETWKRMLDACRRLRISICRDHGFTNWAGAAKLKQQSEHIDGGAVGEAVNKTVNSNYGRKRETVNACI